MCIRDRYQRRVRGTEHWRTMANYSGHGLMSNGSRRNYTYDSYDRAMKRYEEDAARQGGEEEVRTSPARDCDSYMHHRYGYHPNAHHPHAEKPALDQDQESEYQKEIQELKDKLDRSEKDNQELRDENQLLKDGAADSDELEELRSENDELKDKLSRCVDNDLPPEFNFGRRVFQCQIDAPGVGYRNTPSFGDKNKSGTGPCKPQVIITDAICQGPHAVFVREAQVEGGPPSHGWVPLSNPKGDTICFKHLGREEDLRESGELDKYQIAQGRVKTCLLYTSPSPRDS
eukprot:TRINITY_DN587_c0_g1_i11.p1 TRINITY_DN587_c0_g1~~TRINITY_DN587_c0_g1_i11.p1  ORF type:complete len:287 (+),score=81.22 TRINITY_DN587_c0_g1_i11:173-1033(+)